MKDEDLGKTAAVCVSTNLWHVGCFAEREAIRMIGLDEVRSRLTRAFPDADIEIVDLTGSQDHYQVRIASAAFEDRTLLEQHQLVYGALGDFMDGPIHALALQTHAPRGFTRPSRGST